MALSAALIERRGGREAAESRYVAITVQPCGGRRDPSVEEGTPADVYRRPANCFVAEFVGRVNLIRGVVPGQDSVAVVVAVDGCDRRFAAVARNAPTACERPLARLRWAA